MPPEKDIRDPIHGFVRIEGRECDVVDSRALQRLRRVKQLAMAHLVYPGATHTRFEHTLGVLQVAGRLCRRVGIDREHRRLIRLAALLHDTGHGPLSHGSEEVLAAVSAAAGLGTAGGPHDIHERITRRLIRSDPELGRLISERDREDVIALLDKGLDQPLFKDIVSGPIDADKQDYLLRDSHHCGVRYGLYDIDRLQDVLTKVTDERGSTLAVSQDGVNTLEQFVLARYFLTTQVIQHKVRRVTDAMFVRGMKLGVDVDEIDWLRRLYVFEDSPAFVGAYLEWNDERLVSALLDSALESTWAGKFMRRMIERKLLKVLYSEPVLEIADLAFDTKAVAANSASLEAEVAETISSKAGVVVPKEMVIVKIRQAPQTMKSEGPVLVDCSPGPPHTFESRSAIFKSIDQTLRAEHLECYGPLDVSDERKRRSVRTALKELITQRVAALSGPSATGSTSAAEGSHGD